MNDKQTQTKISRSKIKITKKIDDLYSQLKELRDSCTHPNVEKTYLSSTGNYDPSDDRYWIDYKCPDCGKFWSEDQ